MFGKKRPYVLIGKTEEREYLPRRTEDTICVVNSRSVMSWVMAPRRGSVRRVKEIDYPSVRWSVPIMVSAALLLVSGVASAVFGEAIQPLSLAVGSVASYGFPVAAAMTIASLIAFTMRRVWGARIAKKIQKDDDYQHVGSIGRSWMMDLLSERPDMGVSVIDIWRHNCEIRGIKDEMSEGRRLLGVAEDVDRVFIKDRLRELDRELDCARSKRKDIENLFYETHRQVQADRQLDVATPDRRAEVDRWLWGKK